MRPLLYVMELVGVQDVLTPINANTPSYPLDPQRDFGPWGLSFANDRWDLRRAVVLEAVDNMEKPDATTTKPPQDASSRIVRGGRRRLR